MAVTDLAAAPATVRPQIAVRTGGPCLPLQDEVATLLAAGQGARVWLVGGPGSGKTTALRHLAHEFAHEDALHLLDEDAVAVELDGTDGDAERGAAPTGNRVVVAAARTAPTDASGHVWMLQPWSNDDCLAYLQHAHADRVGAAFAAWLRPAPLGDLRRWPDLCRAVLDQLAALAGRADAAADTDPLCALAFVLQDRLGQRRSLVRAQAVQALNVRRGDAAAAAPSPVDARLLASASVRSLLAAEALLLAATQREEPPVPPRVWTPLLVETLGHLVEVDQTLQQRLLALLSRLPKRPALLLSVLCTAVPRFRPPVAQLQDLADARLVGADLGGLVLDGDNSGADLSSSDLQRAILRGANLRGALLRQARLDGADLSAATADRLQADDLSATSLVAERLACAEGSFRRARLDGSKLAGARLLRCDLGQATLVGADLVGADLSYSLCEGTDLRDARLDRAQLPGVDLRSADLRGASFLQATLDEARLDGLDLSHLVAEGASFRGADLSGAVMQAARLRGASLANACLGDADLEDADLRDVDLRGATFDGGAPRTSLGGAAPCSANLRNCDLRGARVDGVDLRLVDLRGARLDPAQREHAARCDALLDRDQRA